MYSKKIFSLYGVILAIALLAGCLSADAQLRSIMPARFIVNAPFSLSGSKHFAAANQGVLAIDTSENWSRIIDSQWLNLPLVKGSDTTGCSALSALGGAVVLLYRSTSCSVNEQAYYAQQAGASVVVVINSSDKLDFSLSSAPFDYPISIPVILIGRSVGDALCAAINSGAPTYVTLTGWGLNVAHDLAFADPVSLPPYSAIPATQLGSSFAATPVYSFFDGAVVANTGTTTETGVTLLSTVNFTPASGITSQVYKDSVLMSGSFSPSDSINFLVAPVSHSISSSVAGRYDVNYHLHSTAGTDNYPVDNYATASMHVTGQTFCKATYDAANDKPVVTSHKRFVVAGSPAYTWGPLFYVAKGGYQAVGARLAIYDGNPAPHDLHAITDEVVVLFKWKETVDSNGVIEPDELTAVGIASVHFDVTDSNDKVVTSNSFIDPANSAPVFLEDTTWYWVAAVTRSNYYLGVSAGANYYTRLLAACTQPSSPVREFWAPQSGKGIDPVSLKLVEPDSVCMYPGTAKDVSYKAVNGISVADGYNVPAMSFNIGTVLNNTAVASGSMAAPSIAVAPNPATDKILVKIKGNLARVPATMYLMNSMGEVVYLSYLSGAIDNTSISTAGIVAGNYYVIITNGVSAAMQKIAVVK